MGQRKQCICLKKEESDDVSFIYKRRDKGVFNEKKNEKTSKKIWRCTNLKDFYKV